MARGLLTWNAVFIAVGYNIATIVVAVGSAVWATSFYPNTEKYPGVAASVSISILLLIALNATYLFYRYSPYKFNQSEIFTKRRLRKTIAVIDFFLILDLIVGSVFLWAR